MKPLTAWLCLWLGMALVAGNVRAAETNSLTLAAAYKETLAGNPDILLARKEIERAAGTKVEIRAADLATFSVETYAGERKGELYDQGGPFALFTAQFAQPVFNSGMAARWRRGEGEIILAEQRLNSTIADKLRDTRIYYLRAQRLRQLIALHEELAARLQNNVTSETERREAGATGPQFLLQAKVQWLAERGDLTALRREQEDSRIEWAELLGRAPTNLPRAAGDLKNPSAMPDWPAAARAALARRADLKLLRQLIANAREDQRVTQANYYPQVSLIGSGLYIPGRQLLYSTPQIIEGQVPYGSEARFGAGLTWQIIDNGQVTGVSREIKAVRQEYEISLRQLEENIPRALARLAHAWGDASAKLAALEQSSRAAEENLRLIESRISLGEATQLDFSDARRNLLATRQGVVEARFQAESALAELDWVTGRYLEFADAAKAN